MKISQEILAQYLLMCQGGKRLSPNTIKAYRIDLSQFSAFCDKEGGAIDKATINQYIGQINETYKPKSAKRKLASLKAFCNYLYLEDLIVENPFSKIHYTVC